MELVFDYMENAGLRRKLNALTQKTFGFDFEDWVSGGYYEGDYIPYSFLEDGKIVSNVSVNRMCFLQNGVQRHYIQLGTVMTEESCRRRGLARRLMEQVIGLWEGQCDGIYLFGDLNALGFYRKLGFTEGLQYRYVLKDTFSERTESRQFFQPVDRQDPFLREKYHTAVRNAALSSRLEQQNKFALQMFYTANLEHVYYSRELDCFAVYDASGGTLCLQSVIGEKPVPLAEVLARIGLPYNTLRLGFTPLPEDASRFTAEPFDGGEDYRLFYMGEKLKSVETEKLCFPALSHA